MFTFAKSAAAVAAIAAAALAAQATAQTPSRIEVYGDWSVFKYTESDGPVCWVSTSPLEWTAVRDGKKTQVNRGDIYLMVSLRPEIGVKNEVAVIAGYPYKENSEVAAKVGKTDFRLFTEGEGAWLDADAEDDRMIAAMKRGREATIVGVSARGTRTTDKFSLMGFTKAMEAARKACE